MGNSHLNITNSERCLYDVLLEGIALEFDIQDLQLERCRLTSCSGREPYRSCYISCPNSDETIVSIRKCLVINERRKKGANGDGVRVLKPKILHMDVDQLCGDPVIDRFFSDAYLRTREKEEEADYSEI